MNRNTESHFAELPQVEIGRSIFDKSMSHKTSFNVGRLIPFTVEEVLPGDTFQVTTSAVVRLQTLLTPIMDNMYMDTYYFFVPSRLCWTHWKQFMGENTESAWIPQTQYSVPVVDWPDGGFAVGTIADYMGIPVNVKPDMQLLDEMPSALPFRAYALICDQWFRDQNVSDPLYIPLGDEMQTGSNGDNYITDVANGGMPFKVAKYHDYFSSALPSPQKGPVVNAVNWSITGDSPVVTRSQSNLEDFPGRPGLSMVQTKDDVTKFGVNYGDSAPHNLQANPSTTGTVAPINLYAVLDSHLSVSVNDLRLAFQLQKFYEKNARAGTRYREILREHFGVTSPDARMQIPEYLGGHRFPLAIHQITNNAQSESDFLGDLGAMSNTTDVHEDFVKSFTEHGYVIGVCCVRYDHSYPQGMAKMWSRRYNTDFYWPVFANIGEQPVREREIFGGTVNGSRVFGYQEAWAEYRYSPNRVSGEMRPGIQNSLASWHLADYYSEAPHLSDSWIREDQNIVDRVLAVTSKVSNQVFADFYIQNTVTRAMPVYSIPGLIDHH